ncbi:larval cuticle protein 1-like, partial [Cydia amplana]|uniref:larval cuticle protein 1-like n=1 Tax=Cydia amplana TaxID=1869771 RepID=UPI002FE54E4D
LQVVFVAALVAVALAAPAEPEPVKILRSEFDQQPEGGYSYAIETEDGVKKEEVGEIKSVNDEENKPHNVVIVRGSYSYTDKEGTPHTLTYVADENGFQPLSEDIPKAPQA